MFSKLTNSYCLLALGGDVNFKVFETELADHIPVVYASIAGTAIVGRLTAGLSVTTLDDVLVPCNFCSQFKYRQQAWFVVAKHHNRPRIVAHSEFAT